MSDTVYKRQPARMRDELGTLLNKYPWTHAFSLAFNSGVVLPTRADKQLGRFMVRLNRKAAGPHWHKRPDENVFAFFFLEKPDVNTHWHGLVWLEPKHLMKLTLASPLDTTVSRLWVNLVSPGTVDVKEIWEKPGWIDYIVKEVRNAVSYESFRPFTGIQ